MSPPRTSARTIHRRGAVKDFFGDLHIHTNFSFVAFTGDVRTTPDDAYLYAKGHPVAHPSGDAIRITGRPLDFLMVADHAELLGVHAALLDPTSPTYGHPDTDSVLPKPGTSLVAAIRQLRELSPPVTRSPAMK